MGANADNETPCACCTETPIDRRDVLVAAAALLMAGVGPAFAGDDNPAALRPQPGDCFTPVSAKDGRKIALADLKIGAPPVVAYPVDPASGVVRKGSRINQVLLAKIDPNLIPEEMKAASVDGVVAYSSICTHNGCPVTVLRPDQRSVICNCHGSIFDLADAGKVLQGPALRRLAHLPVSLAGEELVVAGNFSGAVGPQRQ